MKKVSGGISKEYKQMLHPQYNIPRTERVDEASYLDIISRSIIVKGV